MLVVNELNWAFCYQLEVLCFDKLEVDGEGGLFGYRTVHTCVGVQCACMTHVHRKVSSLTQ